MSALTGSPQRLCPALSAEVNLSSFQEETTPPHHHSLPAARPGGQFHRGHGLAFGGQWPYPIQRVQPKGWGSPESYSGVWGILVHPSPPVQAYLWTTSFIGRIFLVYTQGRRDLSSSGVVSSGWRLDGVRIWKLSRTYPGEKPPSLSVLTHRLSLATRKPTRHLLAIPWILVRIRAPYESGWSTQFHLPRNYGTIFNSRFFNIYV